VTQSMNSKNISNSKASLLPVALTEMHPLTGRPGRSSLLRRFLALLALCSLVIFLVHSYQTRGESSYLDLVFDSLIPDLSELPAEDALPSSSPAQVVYCQDKEGWISEWLSSGVMPKCSLADQKKVDILYTYLPLIPY